jgi:predicted metal-dependent hydrolase
MTEHPMDEIPVRQLRFDFEKLTDHDPVWSRSSPEFAIFINALGVHVPWFERFLVKVMRAYRDEIDDDQLLKDVQAIIGQESHHAFNFIHWNDELAKRYPHIATLDDDAKRYFEDVIASKGRKFRIGFTAGYETFTFLAGMIILNRYDELMGDADPVLRALWVWHQVEEVEHGGVAFDFYQYFHGDDEWYRRAMVVRAFLHIATETFRAYATMVRREGYYRSLRDSFRAWRFFFSFAYDLARAAIPVLSRDYHPRNHPICNDEQNEIAVAWRKYHAGGHNTLAINNEDIGRMLASTGT